MKSLTKLLLLPCILLVFACGNEPDKKKKAPEVKIHKPEVEQAEKPVKASERIVLDNKGVGPITELTLSEEIDEAMVAQGKEVYDQMCLACHRIGKKFIGPAPNGVLKRRSPEWVMNMILDPEKMVKEDPLAKELLIEYNGSPMANQGLTEEQARAILEYFRTLN